MIRYLFFSIIILLSITSCGDDTPDCTPDTIIGTYAGNTDCDDTGTSGVDLPDGPTTFEVTLVSGNNYSITNQDGDETLITIDGCDISIPEIEVDFFGIIIGTSGGGSIDGSEMNLNITTTVDGVTFTCRSTTIKQ